MRRLLADRDLRIYLGGQALSLFGDSALWLALGIWVKSLTGSNSAAGLVFFVFTAPALGAPLAGLLVDRVRRRRLLVGTNLLAAALVCTLLLVRGAGQLWLIYVVTFGYGAVHTVLGSVQSALLRTLVPDDDQLADANGLLRTMQEMMRLFAPVAGAGLYALVGGGAVAVLDAGTFVVAAGALALLRVADARPTHGPAGLPWRTELVAGIRHVRRTVVLRQVVLAVAAALLVVGFTETLVFAVVGSGLHRSPSFVGVLEMAMAAGAVAGGVTSGAAVRRLGAGRAVAAGMATFAAGASLLATGSLAAVLTGMAVLGAGVPALVVGLFTTLQRTTPPELQGRAFSAVDVLVSVPQTVSIGLGAALAAVLDYRLLVAAVVLAVLAAAGYLATRPAQRRPDRPSDPASGPAAHGAPVGPEPAVRMTPG